MIARLLAAAAALALTACMDLVRWPEKQEPAPQREAAEARAPEPSRGQPGKTYVVKPGDTLYSVAFRHNVDYRELAAWNDIDRNYLIFPGRKLRLSPPPGRSRDVIVGPPPKSPVAVAPSSPVSAAPGSRSTPVSPPWKGSYEWRWPAAGPVIRGFDPPTIKGVDIAGAVGDLVRAAAPGKVVYSGTALKGYGELIIIKHDENHLSAYGYNSRRLVQEGDVVAAGQSIGEMGLGPEKLPIVHFEIRRQGRPVDPQGMLPQR